MEVMSLTSPSSPKHLSGFSLSAPTSPRRLTEFYRDFNDLTSSTRNFSDRLTIPFDWEETPGTPRKIDEEEEDVFDDFAFDISNKSETASVFAEELFDGGKIKPLKPPPYLELDSFHFKKSFSPPISSPRSPIAHGKEIFRKAFSPRKKPIEEVDPFEVAIDKARRDVGEERGRGDRRQNSRSRAARSLSPFRVSAYPWEEQEQEVERKESLSTISTSSACVSCKSSSKKWRLKDFLLFRSASEGRARHNKDSVKTFSGLFRKQEETKNSRKSTTKAVSAHEFHYIAKKAETKDLKKKTFLPYMQIGRFAF
ncbi:unnamed protein product [Cochlearia groenlandica]